MDSKGEILQVVCQRISHARLLVSEEEDEWVACGSGLVLYVSFIHSDSAPDALDHARLSKAAKSLMNAKLCTTSGWKLDHSDAESMRALLDGGDVPLSIVVIPQATLAGKIKPGDKYLKYHRQVNKDRGFELYKLFIGSLISQFNLTWDGFGLDKSSFSVIPDKLNIHWGTYSKRQGFEFSSTGPSTHYFEF